MDVRAVALTATATEVSLVAPQALEVSELSEIDPDALAAATRTHLAFAAHADLAEATLLARQSARAIRDTIPGDWAGADAAWVALQFYAFGRIVAQVRRGTLDAADIAALTAPWEMARG